MDILTRAAWDLPADPWSGVDLRTADATRAELLVRAAYDAHAMVSLIGHRGCGKTHAVRRAIAPGVKVVEPLRLDRERLHLGDIQAAIIRDLSDEPMRQSGEARSGQVRRLLGTAQPRTVLFIDDAHCLHPATVRGLKRLRELSYHGRKSLIGVVLAGQRDVTANIPEVGLRSDRLTLAGLTAREAAEALSAGHERAPWAIRRRGDRDACPERPRPQLARFAGRGRRVPGRGPRERCGDDRRGDGAGRAADRWRAGSAAGYRAPGRL